MSEGLVIHRLNTGRIESRDEVGLLGGGLLPGGRRIRQHGWSERIERPDGSIVAGTLVPAPAWYIEGADERILIDTGMGTAAEVIAAQRAYGVCLAVESGPEHDLVAQLGALGVAPEQVDLVIHTHLHFDHVGANDRFPHARFLVHHGELAWALCAPPYYRTTYYPDYARKVRGVLDRVELMVGDVHRVAPGIEAVHTGGHSPGHCAVLVQTPVGSVAIAGDAVANYRNLEYEWPSGNPFDVGAAVRSIQLLKRHDLILVNHDPMFEQLFPSGHVGDEPLSCETMTFMRALRCARSTGREAP
jgi:glyoxylase-like metal-dependent hydrolase (beta-lactamase superfamily II)